MSTSDVRDSIREGRARLDKIKADKTTAGKMPRVADPPSLATLLAAKETAKTNLLYFATLKLTADQNLADAQSADVAAGVLLLEAKSDFDAAESAFDAAVAGLVQP